MPLTKRSEEFRIKRAEKTNSLADRIARKESPIYKKAKDLARRFFEAGLIEDGENYELEEKIFESVAELFDLSDNEKFEEFVQTVMDNLERFDSGPFLKQDFLESLDYIATAEVSSSEEASTLILLPISMMGTPTLFESKIPKKNRSAIIKALKKTDYVHEDAKVILAPMLLSALDVSNMNHRMIRMLADSVASGSESQFHKVLESARGEYGWSEVREEGEGRMLGALVAVVIGTGLVHLPVFASFGDEEEEGVPAQEVSFEDIESANALLAVEISAIPEVKDLAIAGIATPWFDGEIMLRKISRQVVLHTDIMEVLDGAGISSPSGVVIAQVGGLSAGSARFARLGVFSKTNASQVGEVNWPIFDEAVGSEQQESIHGELFAFGIEYKGELDGDMTVDEIHSEVETDGDEDDAKGRVLH